MKSEINNYGINNADGALKNKYGETNGSSVNENLRYDKENFLSAQEETFRASETSDDRKNDSDVVDGAKKSAESSSSSSVAAITRTVGGGIGALSAVVATSVVAAIVVVAVFISTLSINLSLVMANFDSLVFKVEMTGAQEEDFIEPIYAILTSNDGRYFEQEIGPDSAYITFEQLDADTEYFIHVKNSEKLFLERSYFTAPKPVGTAELFASNEENEIFVTVERVELKKGEFYTLTAKNEKGQTVFVKDDDKQSAEYQFIAGEAKRLYVSLSINGKTCAFCQVELEEPIEPEPIEPEEPTEYDFKNPVWEWTSDWTASVLFNKTDGGDPLVLEASVERDVTEPTCETDGRILYVAVAEYDGKSYTDSKEESIEAIGHDYGEPEFEWSQEPTGAFTAVAVFVCMNDQSHIERITADVEQVEDYLYVATVEFNGEIYSDEFEEP